MKKEIPGFENLQKLREDHTKLVNSRVGHATNVSEYTIYVAKMLYHA